MNGFWQNFWPVLGTLAAFAVTAAALAVVYLIGLGLLNLWEAWSDRRALKRARREREEQAETRRVADAVRRSESPYSQHTAWWQAGKYPRGFH